MTKQNASRRRFRKGKRTLREIAHRKRVLSRFGVVRCGCYWKDVDGGTQVLIKCAHHTAREALDG